MNAQYAIASAAISSWLKYLDAAMRSIFGHNYLGIIEEFSQPMRPLEEDIVPKWRTADGEIDWYTKRKIDICRVLEREWLMRLRKRVADMEDLPADDRGAFIEWEKRVLRKRLVTGAIQGRLQRRFYEMMDGPVLAEVAKAVKKREAKAAKAAKPKVIKTIVRGTAPYVRKRNNVNPTPATSSV